MFGSFCQEQSPPPEVHLPWQEEEFQPRNYQCLENKQNKHNLTKANVFLVRISSFPSIKGISQPKFQLKFLCRVLIHLQSSSARTMVLTVGCFALYIPKCSHFQPSFQGLLSVHPLWGCASRHSPCVPCGCSVWNEGKQLHWGKDPGFGASLCKSGPCSTFRYLLGTSRLV